MLGLYNFISALVPTGRRQWIGDSELDRVEDGKISCFWLPVCLVTKLSFLLEQGPGVIDEFQVSSIEFLDNEDNGSYLKV